MALPRIISTSVLHKAIKEIPKVRVIDCTYKPGPKPGYNEFKQKWYGKFEELRKRPSEQKTAYLNEHIPSAVHFDLAVGSYPGKYERYGIYEPEVFEKYAQLLGINNDDHLAFYGRGPFGGMLFPARCLILFKAYGHKNMSLVNGGFADWKKNNFETESTNDYPSIERGNFKAKNELDKNIIKFEEFNKKGGILDDTSLSNVFDTRIRPQFEGTQETGLNPQYVTGTRIPHTINVPAIEFIDKDGLLKPLNQIQRELFKDYKAEKPTVTFCNAGIQASLAAVIQQDIFPGAKIRVYNGSLTEMQIRAPERISDGSMI